MPPLQLNVVKISDLHYRVEVGEYVVEVKRDDETGEMKWNGYLKPSGVPAGDPPPAPPAPVKKKFKTLLGD